MCRKLKLKIQVEEKKDDGVDNAVGNYGDYGIINSSVVIERDYVPVGQLNLSKKDQTVWIRARLQNSRVKVRFTFPYNSNSITFQRIKNSSKMFR